MGPATPGREGHMRRATWNMSLDERDRDAETRWISSNLRRAQQGGRADFKKFALISTRQDGSIRADSPFLLILRDGGANGCPESNGRHAEPNETVHIHHV